MAMLIFFIWFTRSRSANNFVPTCVSNNLKRLNIVRFVYRQDQNKGIHKSHVFVLRQVNLKELESYRL